MANFTHPAPTEKKRVREITSIISRPIIYFHFAGFFLSSEANSCDRSGLLIWPNTCSTHGPGLIHHPGSAAARYDGAIRPRLKTLVSRVLQGLLLCSTPPSASCAALPSSSAIRAPEPGGLPDARGCFAFHSPCNSPSRLRTHQGEARRRVGLCLLQRCIAAHWSSVSFAHACGPFAVRQRCVAHAIPRSSSNRVSSLTHLPFPNPFLLCSHILPRGRRAPNRHFPRRSRRCYSPSRPRTHQGEARRRIGLCLLQRCIAAHWSSVSFAHACGPFAVRQRCDSHAIPRSSSNRVSSLTHLPFPNPFLLCSHILPRGRRAPNRHFPKTSRCPRTRTPNT
jgi:hypothetical protein